MVNQQRRLDCGTPSPTNLGRKRKEENKDQPGKSQQSEKTEHAKVRGFRTIWLKVLVFSVGRVEKVPGSRPHDCLE